MFHRLSHIGERLRCDARGVSTIEFALLCPILILLLAGLVDLSRGLAERFALQQAVNRGLEMVQARPPRIRAGQPDYDFSYVRNETATAANVPPQSVTLTRWAECNGVRHNISHTCAAEERSARFLQVHVAKAYQPQLMPGSFMLEVSAAVRTQ